MSVLYLFPAFYKGAVARAALLLVHKREFGTYLAHVRSMPILQLGIPFEFLRPVLEMRVGLLLRTHRRHSEYRQRHYYHLFCFHTSITFAV